MMIDAVFDYAPHEDFHFYAFFAGFRELGLHICCAPSAELYMALSRLRIGGTSQAVTQ